ncbi:MAG: NADH-quinone oxidoreductase subunit NuoG [Gammaproteobacteria bacterium]
MATIYVDDKPFAVDGDRDLLEQCLSLGFDLPYFCWHPAMGSVGACRQCAVKRFKDENDKEGHIVMACMTPAADGTRISIEAPEVRQFRGSIIEWLMENHPHDCPVCDEGGECHLQDMTVMTGHNYRSYRFDKRTFRNQDLGPFINHEMNRCITCYRCVRFYDDYAGGTDLFAMASKNHVYFGRHDDGTLESEFSGNLVEVCPTGVFTDKSLQTHYTRKWDLQTAPSVCVHCGHGCNIIPGERYDSLRRIRNRYNGDVNGYFICDRGRYGYEFVNGDHRIREARLRDADEQRPPQPASLEAVMDRIGSLLGAGRVLGLGSPRASLEANFALRCLVGAENFCAGLGARGDALNREALAILRAGPAPTATLPEVERADAVLVLGENVPDTAPRLALALRQSVRQQSMELADQLKIPRWQDAAVREAAGTALSPLFVVTPAPTRLDDVASGSRHGAPADIARLGFAVAQGLDPQAPSVNGLSEADRRWVDSVVSALADARRPLVVSGTGCGDRDVLRAAANVATALARLHKATRLSLVTPECNSLGLAMLDPRPLETAVSAGQDNDLDTLIVLENDLFRRLPRQTADALLSAAAHVITVDCIDHDTVARSEVVLPAAAFSEGEGTLVNSEGRAQRFYKSNQAAHPIQESWRWLQAMAAVSDGVETIHWHHLDDVTAQCAALGGELAAITEAAPPASQRVVHQRIPRQPHRYSGRTAMHAAATIHEPIPHRDLDSPLAFSMEGYLGAPAPALIPRFWAPGWNSIQALNKFQSEVAGALVGGDPGRRLLEAGGDGRYFDRIPAAFNPRKGQWRVVPLYHVFGSEPLSALSPPLRSRTPEPYLAIGPEDARRLGVKDGTTVQVGALDGRSFTVRLQPGLARGTVGLPAGLPGLAQEAFPDWTTLHGGDGL